MNIFEQLGGHAIVELNQSTGLRTGHLVAQAKFANTENMKELDNGYILALNEKGELRLAGADETAYFLHYSEEHIKYLDTASLDMFTVPLKANGKDVDAYPRAIALYEGDVFTTDNFEGEPESGKYYKVKLTDGKLELDGEVDGLYNGPVAVLSSLPAGQTAVQVTWRGGL